MDICTATTSKAWTTAQQQHQNHGQLHINNITSMDHCTATTSQAWTTAQQQHQKHVQLHTINIKNNKNMENFTAKTTKP